MIDFTDANVMRDRMSDDIEHGRDPLIRIIRDYDFSNPTPDIFRCYYEINVRGTQWIDELTMPSLYDDSAKHWELLNVEQFLSADPLAYVLCRLKVNKRNAKKHKPQIEQEREVNELTNVYPIAKEIVEVKPKKTKHRPNLQYEGSAECLYIDMIEAIKSGNNPIVKKVLNPSTNKDRYYLITHDKHGKKSVLLNPHLVASMIKHGKLGAIGAENENEYVLYPQPKHIMFPKNATGDFVVVNLYETVEECELARMRYPNDFSIKYAWWHDKGIIE